MLNKYFFYIPFSYRFYTRKSGKNSIIPFFLTDFLPPFFYLLLEKCTISINDIFIYTISYIIMFICYEYGYIINDSITVTYEKKPTLRITKEEQKYFYKKGVLITGIKIFQIILLSILLIYIYKQSIDKLLISCLILLTIYCLNNYYRNFIRYITNLLLNTAKYFIPVILVLECEVNLASILFFIYYPLTRFICYVIKHSTNYKTTLIDAIQCISASLCAVTLLFFCIFYNLQYYSFIFSLLFVIYRFSILLYRKIK